MRKFLKTFLFLPLLLNSCVSANNEPNGTPRPYDVNNVRFRGDSTLMNMRIESSYFANGAFLIETTGARFEYVKSELKIYQGLDKVNRRLLSTIAFDNEPNFIKVEDSNDHILFWSKDFNIGIYKNSGCIIGAKNEINALCGKTKIKYNLKKDQYLVISKYGQIKVCATKSDAEQSINGPMIIWFYNAAADKPAVLKTALANNWIVTHVLMLYLNPMDVKLANVSNVLEAVKLCREQGVKIIWCRTLFPSYEVKLFKRQDLFDPNYYKTTIDQVREEARILNADFTAIDTEAYVYFPYKLEFREPINKVDFNKMKQAIDAAVAAKGQVDFVLPAPSMAPTQVTNAEIRLGKYKIAEHTYYNIKGISKNPKRPFDIFGAYIRTTTRNDIYPDRPHFTPKEILERQDLWGGCKGLMLYPYEKEVDKVAAMLSQIKYIEPNGF